MDRRTFLGLAAGAPLALGLGATQGGRKPNLLILLCDQWRGCDVGCMGNADLPTPVLDRMAAEGSIFRHCFSVSPVCSVYRGQFMTGRYPWHNGVERNGSAMTPGQPFLAEVLKTHGYATGYIGKWHLSGLRDERDFVPTNLRAGWDWWFGVNEGKKPESSYYFSDDGRLQIKVDGLEPAFHVEKAMEFLKIPRSQPFALMVSFNPPHGGKAPEEYNRFKNPTLRPNVPEARKDEAKRKVSGYWAEIAWMDAEIGKLLANLDSSGLAENTLVVFTSDHGNMIESQGVDRKLRPWDESSQVPLIVRHPAGIRPGTVVDPMISSVDLMPTLLGLLGVEGPPGMDGKDLSPLLRGKPVPDAEHTYLSCRGINPEGPGFDWRAVRSKDWLYAVHKGGDWLLYDLANDPFQLKNLVTDAALGEELKRLKGVLEDFRKKTGDEGELASAVTLPPPGALHSPDAPVEGNRKERGKGKRGDAAPRGEGK